MSADRVRASLEDLDGFTANSVIRAHTCRTMAIRAHSAVEQFNAGCEPRYRVGLVGAAVAELGNAIELLDGFPAEIASRLRAADSGTITYEIAAAAIALQIPTAVGLERVAGDLALSVLGDRFETLDVISGGTSDGVVSTHDLSDAAHQTQDVVLREAAMWLLAHRAVIGAIDRANEALVPGSMSLPAKDGRITADDLHAYERFRAAYQVMMDSFETFDMAASGTLDGKVSRADLRRMASPPFAPELVEAADVLLNDPRPLGGFVSFGDQVAGIYDLQRVAASFGEVRPAIPFKGRNAFLRAGCSFASVYSYLGFVTLGQAILRRDAHGAALEAGGLGQGKVLSGLGTTLLLEASVNLEAKVARRAIAQEAALLATSRAAESLATASSLPAFGVAMTAVDALCKATDPKKKTWGKVRRTERN